MANDIEDEVERKDGISGWDVDRLIHRKNPEQYRRNWQKRCGDCLAPCCLMNMSGHHNMDIGSKSYGDNTPQEFFTHSFVVLGVKEMKWKTVTEEWGFEIRLQTGEFDGNTVNDNRGLNICPLFNGDTCLIYEDRPLICRIFTCVMATEFNKIG